ncbi:MAG: type I-E CRISPR-associated endonuclease Cas1e [Ignavibacteria bacterium]|nr:type I-E CRISPR-associated endonuclease Cas1e [Ignavibacteria bacterium]
MVNYRGLPKIRDSLSYIYAEHCIVEKEQQALKLVQQDGIVPIPIAGLSVLMLGPGTRITHDAVRISAENGLTILWSGEESVRMYAAGTGETRGASRLLQQARLWANEEDRLRIIVQMYRRRFPEPLPPGLTLQQIRGREGIRVRNAYAECSKKYNVAWNGRSYDRQGWHNSDPVNRALSVANSCLYGVCHAAIVSAGYSPAIGFIHTGKQLSFVYDVADMYKLETTVPASFEAVAENEADLEKRVRYKLRDFFKESRLLESIVSDLDELLRVPANEDTTLDNDGARPTEYWNPPLELERKVLCLS